MLENYMKTQTHARIFSAFISPEIIRKPLAVMILMRIEVN